MPSIADIIRIAIMLFFATRAIIGNIDSSAIIRPFSQGAKRDLNIGYYYS